jgi:hypothetical protein
MLFFFTEHPAAMVTIIKMAIVCLLYFIILFNCCLYIKGVVKLQDGKNILFFGINQAKMENSIVEWNNN